MTQKNFTIFCVLLVSFLLLSGCAAMSLFQRNDCRLTITVEGNGTVSPAEGRHLYDCGRTITVEATPDIGWLFFEWQGPVADRSNEITSVTIDKNLEIKAVFIHPGAASPEGTPVTDPDEEDAIVKAPAESKGAYALEVMQGEGVRSEYEIWNCTGLEGQWHWFSKLIMAGYGTAEGETMFIMPPRPSDPNQPWESLPFDAEFEGSFIVDGVEGILKSTSTNIVVTIEENPTGDFMYWRGSGTVTVSVPSMGFSINQPVTDTNQGPIFLERGSHSRCN
jgi:hypothetical protein